MDPLTVAGLVFTGLTAASMVGLHFGRVRVPRVGAWRNPPNVYVEIPGPVSVGEVKRAVAWWKGLGFKLGDVHRIEDDARDSIPGAIVVGHMRAAYMAEAAGHASWQADYEQAEDEQDELVSNAADILGPLDGGFIRYARIGVRTGMSDDHKQKTLRHELGHALGFLHCETALFGRRKKDSKSGKRKAGDARLRVVGRKKGHVMHPSIADMGSSTKGMIP